MPTNLSTLSNYWSQPSEQLMQSVDSRPTGLTSGEAQQRLAVSGPNRLEIREKATPLMLFLNQFKSPIVLILLFATVVSAFVSDWVDAVIILLIVLGSALLSFYQEYNAGNAVAQLQARVQPKSTVMRDNQAVAVPSETIVPGDIVLLSAGSLIPADGIVLETDDFFVNQAALTGETFPVEKKPSLAPENAGLAERTNVVFMGTNVYSGSAHALIIETGTRTAFGQISKSLTLRPPETEFEHGIRRLGYLLTEIMFVLVIGILAFNVLFHKPLLDSLLFSIALAVGLTPQLLPAIININLAKGSQVMAARGVIVRRLESIENFGSMDILCTDKTGTLTAGVVQLDCALGVDAEPSDQALLYAYLNATLQTGLANPLDDAIAKMKSVGAEEFTKVDEIPYDFVRKRLSVVVADPQGNHLLIAKGALDNILAVCTLVQSGGSEQALDDDYLAGIRRKFEAWSTQGYRVLGVAQKRVPVQDQPYPKTIETELTFMGFLLFLDPPKDGARQTIQDLKKLRI